MAKHRFFYGYKRDFARFISTHVSSIQLIVSYYAILTVIAFILLKLPFFRNPGIQTTFLDDAFMAVSTVSVTGLSTFNINEVFNDRGVILLEILFQVGGLGIMMVSTFFFIVSRRKISLKQRQLIMTDMNQPRLSGIVRLIRTTLGIILWIQFIFGSIFSVHFYLSNHHATIRDAIFYGFYQAISAVTNSGFDVTGGSIEPYANDYFFIICIIILIMIGGIGFPVIMEIKEWLFFKKKRRGYPFRFSLFSKLAIGSFIILFVAGTLFIYLLERNHLFADMPSSQRLITSMFYSMTTRNAGLQINDLNQFQTPTLILFSTLMFIGCSPSSVGGGVRTTTVAIVVLYLFSFIKSEENISIFGRRISDEDVKKAIVVFNLSLLMCFFSVMVLSATEDHSLISIIVEVASAFGTTGLSLGITDDLTTVGKIIIAALMFIGRIGMLYTLMLFIPKEMQDKGYLYPTEKIIIG
ncbi:TrkH family potassium uptake protein [Vagococcus salmoninarum]|uniref:Ktr system potassium uptake protein D n=3 Tax=Vagococcus salmoninarum TaxID=2739 RepID=A0A429ZTX7_9ENTE|nr:potassium transporter TrkG [Vagococcus salmoninarum]MBE9388418.1 TrkH family potassium uptake protein [Vagococcus salmoninarum]RST97114.1 Ktr system potassium uptake protein D [Vagococcus salmoninarum]